MQCTEFIDLVRARILLLWQESSGTKWRYAGTFIATLMNVRLGIVSAVRSQGLELSRREIPYWHRIVENGESFACRWVEARTLSALLQIIRRLWLLRKRM
jgi:hypothetical protein